APRTAHAHTETPAKGSTPAASNQPPAVPLSRASSGSRLGLSLAAQDVRQTIVPFVTRVFEDVLADARDGHLALPRNVPGLRIGYRELVLDRVRVDHRVALGHLQLVGGPAPVPPFVEISSLDDQCVSVPPAARVAAQPLDPIARARPAVERYDARHTHHLRHDDECLWGLDDPQVRVVAGRQDGRS